MKIKINAKECDVVLRLSLLGKNYKTYENGCEIRSQWIADGETGLLILSFDLVGEHIVEIIETNEESFLAKEHCKEFFPSYNGVEFYDRAVGVVFVEREKEAQAGKVYYLKNDLFPEVYSFEGNLARVVSAKAYYCDDDNNRAPFSPYAEYKWIYFNGLVLLSAKLTNVENYSVSVLAPSLKDKEIYKGGYPDLCGNAKNVGFGFDGYAIHYSKDACVGVFSASCLVLPDCLVGASISKDCNKHGNEICTAVLYYGNSENVEKYAKNGVSYFNYDIEYLFDDYDFVYELTSLRLYAKRTIGGVKWGIQSKDFSTIGYVPPFRIITENGIICSDKNWESVCFLKDCIELKNKNGDCAKIFISERDGDLAVSLDVCVPKISEVYFPQISVTAKGRVDLFVPSCAGQIENNVLSRDVRYRESYSGPFANMSFLGAIKENESSLYVCWEGEGERFDYVVNTSVSSKSVNISALLYPENMCETGHFCTNKVVVSQTQNGWRGMCEKYRNYVKNSVWWNKCAPVNSKMTDNRLWLWSHFRWEDENGRLFKGDEAATEWYLVIKKLKEQIDHPLGIMAYDCFDCVPLAYRTDLWNMNVSNEEQLSKTGDGITVKQTHHETGTNYMPHYTPFRKGVLEVVKKLQAEGDCVLPYVDNRLWDPRDTLLGDYEENWENTGKHISVKQKDGTPLMEYYCHHLPDGSPANSAVICPFTKKWQQINVDFVSDIIDGLGVDGVYLDQISAMSPALCMDKTHGHPLGGGTWWREGFEHIVKGMREKYPDAIFTSECEAEPYMHLHDAYLSWTHVLPNQVPAYSAVYSDRIIQYGRTPVCFLDDVVDQSRVFEVRAQYAQSYLFGEQLGFMFMRAMLACGERLIPFINKLLNERQAIKEYFNYGRLVCVPEMKTDTIFCNLWGRDMRPVYIPHIYGAVWEYKGNKKLLLVNAFDSVGVAEWKANLDNPYFTEKTHIEGKRLFDGVAFALEPQSVMTIDIIEE